MFFTRRKAEMISEPDALPGRASPIPTASKHFVSGVALKGPYPEGFETVVFGMGCYWGVEREFWSLPGVYVTSVGNAGGFTPNPTYEEVCTGQTGHTEVVQVVYDPAVTSLEALLQVFWEGHDPTQGFRQGNDTGTQYRSAIYWTKPEHEAIVLKSRDMFQTALSKAGFGKITTELAPLKAYYFAEDYHQQYLAKNPNGYCGLAGTGVSCPVGLLAAE